ncbi:MAG: thioredoxin [Fusobacteria bacterium]|nr:thioredoxin [Fusobacteriota bacterium]
MSTMQITKDNYEQEVLKSNQPVLLDFWAPWCGPCKMIGPIVEEISNEVSGTAKVGKVNVDEEMELAQAFNVMSIPTLVVVKEGKIINSTIGFQSKEALLDLLK